MTARNPHAGDAPGLLDLTVTIAVAYLRHHALGAGELSTLLRQTHDALATLRPGGAPPSPAVEIARSVHHEHVVCLEDGKKFKLLRRHLSMSHGMSGEDYRRRWGLSAHYPLVAPAYGALRSRVAKRAKLGHRGALAWARPPRD